MNMKWLTLTFAVLALAHSITTVADASADDGFHGAYVAKLDLNPLGIPRIEAMALILHKDGTVSFTSEHEPNDLSTSGIGVWQQLSKNRIGLGLFVYRMGVEGVCGAVGVMTPDNCVLRIGSTLRLTRHGSLRGTMLLTIEGPDVVELPPKLPFKMRRLHLSEFRGSLPRHQ